MTSTFPTVRMRRLRANAAVRALFQENTISVKDLILPLFIHHGTNCKKPISSMPGHFQISTDVLVDEIKQIRDLGIPGVLLFGIPASKDAVGSSSHTSGNIIEQAIQVIKDTAPELLVITDSCLCEYTDHGHCGVLAQDHKQVVIDNDTTLEILAQQAVNYAQAGADIIAPSGMIDGMVTTIRQALDSQGFNLTPIMSYAVKYASGLYGPFREAAEGAPKFGDRKSYQMHPANGDEALREVAIDLAEGADMIMVKPATLYLDVLARIKDAFPGVPLAAYQVSGEYAMIKAAAAQGWINEQQVALEALLAIKRAGAACIISYYAKEVAQYLNLPKALEL